MKILLRSACLLCLAVPTPAAPASAANFDLLISNGRVLDGSGNPWFRADVGVRAGRIVAVGDLAGKSARETFDATGKWVVPGFIDLHSHADDADVEGRGLRSPDLRRRAAASVVAQGITTVLVNPDGSAPDMSIADQASRLEAGGIGPNAALMVGHNRIRAQVLGTMHRRAAAPAELQRIRALLLEGLAQGAFGLSTGLEYAPAIWSDTAELIALASELPAFGAVFSAHVRSQGAAPMWWLPSRDAADPPTLVDAISETIRIGEASGATVVATHLKARGTDYWGAATQVVSMIRQARARGVSVYGDLYPYDTSFSDGALRLVPDWALGEVPQPVIRVDYAARLRELLLDPKRAAALRRDIDFTLGDRGGPQHIRVMEASDATLVGRTIAEIAQERSIAPVELAIALQLEGDRFLRGGVHLRSFSLAEQDIETYMREPWVAIATDGGISLPEDGRVHIRNYGTFPKAIAYYARDRGVVTVEHAVHAATGLPARILGLTNRGHVRAGQAADLAVLDPVRLGETGDFEDSHRLPDGVVSVWIAGVAVVKDGRPTGALPGKVLKPTREVRSAAIPAHKLQDIEQVIAAAMAAQQLPAVSVAIGLDGKLAWTGDFGMADLENSVAASEQTRYRTASISKWMTATAAMRLAELGKLDLDAPVQRYCRAYPEKPWPVLVRNVLNHTAGVRHYHGDNGEPQDTAQQRRTLAERIRLEQLGQYVRHTDSVTPIAVFADDPLIFEPGTRYHYTSFGYRLLGCVIEGAAGSYRKWMREAVFEKAGMSDTVDDDHWAIVPHRASGYGMTEGGKLRRADFRDISENLPAGGHLSTAADMVRFALAFEGDELVSAASRKRMLAAPEYPETDAADYYGFGVKVAHPSKSRIPGELTLSHSGGQNGTSTHLLILPRRGLAVAVMSNKEDAEPGDIAVTIAARLVDAPRGAGEMSR